MQDKLSDLVGLLKRANRPVTRRLLETRWNCSSVTVHRIIASARKGGIPIRFEKDRYCLEDAKAIEVPGIWFRPEELAALLGLSHWLDEMLTGQGLNSVAWQERIRFLPMHYRQIDPDTLLACARAVLLRRRTTFLYQGVKDGNARERNVSPQTLVRYRDNWYLDGYDHDVEKLREFSLSRIRDLDVQGTSALEVDRKHLDKHFGDAYGIFAGRARKKAVLLFTGLAARLAGHRHNHPGHHTAGKTHRERRFARPYAHAHLDMERQRR